MKLRAKATTNRTALKLIPTHADVKVQKSKYGNSVGRFIGSTHYARSSKGTSNKNIWYKVAYKESTGYSPGNCLSPR